MQLQIARSELCSASLPVAPRTARFAAQRAQQRPITGRQAQRANARKLVVRAEAKEAAPAASKPVQNTNEPMNLVFISTEVAPWSKTGGLGDVVGSLPVELAKRGHSVISIAPRYDQAGAAGGGGGGAAGARGKLYWDAWDTDVVINVDGEDVRFFHSIKNGVHRVWIDHPWFLARVWGLTGSKLYGAKSGADFVDNQRRFALFCKAALESLRALPFGPGEDATIIANDWHSALVPVLLKDVYQPAGEFLNTKVALTIHNIAFQGRFWEDSFKQLGLPASSLPRFQFTDGAAGGEAVPRGALARGPRAAAAERESRCGGAPAGITAADRVLTVSPNYASEIASGPAPGVELDDVIAAKGVEGIVNGMDVAEWSPARDKFLAFKYNAETVEAGKAYAKAQLQREVGLPVDPKAPLFGFIGRLEEQKGVDILLAAVKKLPKAANIVVLGTGKKTLEAAVKNLGTEYPGHAAGVVEFSNPMAHLITAGADYMLVPSRFEPCGLIQLHAMTYGTVPLVASVGGLVDTVKEGVTGLHFGAMDTDALLDSDAEAVAATILRATELYGTPAHAAMRDASIAQDLSWAQPAKKWEAILTELKFGPGPTPEATAVKQAVPTPVKKVEDPTLASV
eukprot:scaffold3.g6320.t1